MHRVTSIVPAGQWPNAAAIDRVVLDAAERTRRRIVLTGEEGTQILLDFEKPVTLRDGDGLVLDDGSMVRVCGKPEPLVEIAASSPNALARLAWHLGNRHTDVQIVGERLRIRRDHVLEDMLRGLGAALSFLDAPFDPESGAYAGGPIHGHAHGHAHGHGDHGHAYNHSHDDGDHHGHSHRRGHSHGR
ncbi:MAG: urease accessory protein UreE [Pseudorhodoplanes sp.]|nr:urease accessory protein UreE [Pseudorhodoplanes sp.]